MNLAFYAVLALGIGLRLYGLDRESLWNDELSTLSRLNPGPFSNVFWEKIAGDVHPPGYLLLLAGWSALFGNSEIALRLPSVLAGSALLGLLYACVKKRFGEATGVLAALFCAVSPLHIRYSQEARSFALVTCTSFVAAWALLELIEPPRLAQHTRLQDVRKQTRWLSVFVGSAAASAYLSYVGLLAVVAALTFVCAITLWSARDRSARIATGSILLVVAYLPWGQGFLSHLARGGLSWLDPPVPSDLFRGFSLAMPLHGWVLLASAIAFWTAHGEASKEPTTPSARSRRGSAITMALWLGFLLPLSFYVKSVWSAPIYNDRNLLVIVPFFALLAAAALGQTVSAWRAVASGSLIASVVFFHFVFVDRFYTSPIKQDFRGAARLAATWTRDHSVNRVVCLAWNKAYFEYYLEKSGVDPKLSCSSNSTGVGEKLHKLRNSKAPVAFVYGHIAPNAALWRRIRKDFDVVENHSLHKAGAALLRSK